MAVQHQPARGEVINPFSPPAASAGSLQDVYVHIGPPKSGTTFVQNVLFRNRELLAENGVVLPRRDWQAHRRSAAALMRRDADFPVRPLRRERVRDGWDRLVRDVDASGAQTAILSVERLAMAESVAVAAMVETFAPARLHLVYTARDLARVVPSEWQTRLRSRASPTWADFVASVRDPGGPETEGGRFWRRQDPAASLRPWLEHVPLERVSVVTVPPSGSDRSLLWRRFCSATGLTAEGFDLDVERSNISLGGVEAEVLRRLNARVTDQISASSYTDLLHHFMARELLETREQSFRLVLPEAEHDWLNPRAQEVIDYLRTSGFRVVGDLADLTPVRSPAPRAPDDVSNEEVLAVTEQVLAGTIVEMARRVELARSARARSDDASVGQRVTRPRGRSSRSA